MDIINRIYLVSGYNHLKKTGTQLLDVNGPYVESTRYVLDITPNREVIGESTQQWYKYLEQSGCEKIQLIANYKTLQVYGLNNAQYMYHLNCIYQTKSQFWSLVSSTFNEQTKKQMTHTMVLTDLNVTTIICKQKSLY